MIGPLRHKLQRLRSERVADAGGGAAAIWLDAGELWARVEYLTPTRDLTGDRRSFLKRIAAEIRFDASIKEGDRVRFDAGDFEIVSIETIDDRQRRYVLVCEEVLPT